MTNINTKQAAHLIMRVTEPQKGQGQLHHREKPAEKKQGEGNNGGGNGGGKKAPGFSGESSFESAPVSPNTYIDACWKPEQTKHTLTVKRNSPVVIYALTGGALNTDVTVHIYHSISGENKRILELSGEMKNGRVDINWNAQNVNSDWNKGHYFFMIVGAQGKKVSRNILILK